MQTKCENCNGRGNCIPANDLCLTCNGERVVKLAKTINVNIVKGMRDQEQIFVANEENVVVILNQIKHEVFARRNSDLIMEKHISLYEALAGFSFTIKHLDNRTLYVKNEPNSVIKPGDIKCIRGEGMPTKRINGNMYIEFFIDFPTYAEISVNIEKLKETLPHECKTDKIPEDVEEYTLETVTVEHNDEEHVPQCPTQ